MEKFKKHSTNTLIRKDDSFEISIYNDKLTPECVGENTVKLKQSFPALPNGFYDVFYERLKANNYTDKRLNDAIGHVIDNCIYPTPTIAQFISFDKRMKLYSYEDVLKINDQTQSAFQTYRPVRFSDNPKPIYAHVNDIVEYKLKEWKNEPTD